MVYTADGADPRLSNGDIAPDAIHSSEAVIFPEGSPYRARSYNQFLGAWPGTKWSRAIPGDIGIPYDPSPRVVNLFFRAFVGSGDNVVVSGLVVTDTDEKYVLLRGIGPSLGGFRVTDPLAEPVLTVFNADNEVVAQNSGWDNGDNGETIARAAESAGAFPAHSKLR